MFIETQIKTLDVWLKLMRGWTFFKATDVLVRLLLEGHFNSPTFTIIIFLFHKIIQLSLVQVYEKSTNKGQIKFPFLKCDEG